MGEAFQDLDSARVYKILSHDNMVVKSGHTKRSGALIYRQNDDSVSICVPIDFHGRLKREMQCMVGSIRQWSHSPGFQRLKRIKKLVAVVREFTQFDMVWYMLLLAVTERNKTESYSFGLITGQGGGMNCNVL